MKRAFQASLLITPTWTRGGSREYTGRMSAPPLSPTTHDAADDSVLDFCCGGKKKCPKLTDDGDGFVLSDVDQSPAPIRLTREQGASVMVWLERRLGSGASGT